MSDLLKLFIVGIYLFLVYKYYKNTILLLLFTLALILILCNINKVTEGYSGGGMWVEQYAAPNFKSINSFDNVNVNTNSNVNTNVNVNTNNNTIDIKSNNNGDYVDVENIVDNLVIPVSPLNYQMGPFDQLVLTTGNPQSEYLRLNDVPLATKEDVCVYQGHENPLKCKKTTGLNIGPTVNGVEDSPRSMFMFKYNKSSPSCCPSTFSTSTGCVCTTENQRQFVNRRGMGVSK